jgi:hypothetical protein
MKKSSIIIAAFLVGGSIVLLWAWSYFGFDQIDYPSSLLLCIVWWVLIVAAVSLVIHAEHKRREAIRTIYVGPRVLFNSEQGIVACPDPVARVSVMYEMLKSLTYNFRKEGQPNFDEFDYCSLVRTKKFRDGTKGSNNERVLLCDDPHATEDLDSLHNARILSNEIAASDNASKNVSDGSIPGDGLAPSADRATLLNDDSADTGLCMPEDAGDLYDTFAHIKWEGSVITINRTHGNRAREFHSPRELAVLLLDIPSDSDDDDLPTDSCRAVSSTKN